jgi:hypothetical protein
MNITNATLFPDLDGLAKSIAFELEIIWKGLVAEPQPKGSHGNEVEAIPKDPTTDGAMA